MAAKPSDMERLDEGELRSVLHRRFGGAELSDVHCSRANKIKKAAPLGGS